MAIPAIKFPNNIDDATSLFAVLNNIETSLSAPIDGIVTTIPVADTTGFPTSGFISIDQEIIHYSSLDATNFLGCTRGQDGTSNAPHLISTLVNLRVIAIHHNRLKDAIIAIEQSPFLMGNDASKPASPLQGWWYFAIDTGTLYKCKTNGSWVPETYMLGTKQVDETDIADGKTPTYDSAAGTLKYKNPNATYAA